MKPRVLFLGGEKGSWTVRGHQIGHALGARVTTEPTNRDWLWADVVVCVKQALARFGHTARSRHLPVIWDVLDYWQQPEENQRPEAECIADVNRRAVQADCVALIGATKKMALDIGGRYIPHHSRPGLIPTPPRDRLGVVAYEGRVKYLGAWRPALELACARLGAQFVINPRCLSEADVVVAFRDEPWDGWACREWKSGVKYVNATVAGRPIVTQVSAAFYEIGPVGCAIEQTGTLEEGLKIAFDQRRLAYARGQDRKGTYSLEAISKQFRAVIQSALRVAA